MTMISMCCAFVPEGTGGRRITDITVALHLRNKHMYENVSMLQELTIDYVIQTEEWELTTDHSAMACMRTGAEGQGST